MKLVCTPTGDEPEIIDLCDVIEVRLDLLSPDLVNKIIENSEKELIFTCRRKLEGGMYEGEEGKRLEILSRYVMYADYMDIEHDVEDEFFKAVKSATRVIESYYGSNPGYEHFKNLIEGKRGDVIKIVIFPKDRDDLRLILRLHSEYEDLIAFLAGKKYAYTRVISSLVGHPFIYCYPGTKTQYGVEEVSHLRKMLFG